MVGGDLRALRVGCSYNRVCFFHGECILLVFVGDVFTKSVSRGSTIARYGYMIVR
jgi:hypothetical protein